MPPPNILYIHSHDTGRYIQPYGHAVPTPSMQRLAEQGVLFRQNFCAAPTCSPSRAALLTGQSPHSSGMLGLTHNGWTLKDYRRHIVHTLREAGYYSALTGVQHIAADANVIGYDHVGTTGQRSDADTTVSEAVDFLDNPPSQPFFLTVGFWETHRPFREPGPDDDARYSLPPAPMPDTPEVRRDMAAFKATARIFDQSVGTVLEALDRNGLSDNTLVICTTDHGIEFPYMKCNLTDHGTGVMLIMRGPGGFTGGKVCDALVSHVDIFPTICDLLGIDNPGWLQGTSMMPLIRGEMDEINEAVFTEATYHSAYEPQRAVRTRRWKYIRRFESREAPVLPNCDDSPSKDVWMENGWRERPMAPEQLYDLVFDPNEASNIAGDARMAGVLDEMRNRLEEWMRVTDDPLLNGPVPPAIAGRVSDPDGVSPGDGMTVPAVRLETHLE